MFSQFAKKIGFQTIREYEDSKLARVEQRVREKAELNAAVQEYKNQLDYIESNNVDEELKKTNEKLTNFENELSQRQKENENDTKKMEKEEQALKTIETENEKIANEAKTKKNKLLELKKDIQKKTR